VMGFGTFDDSCLLIRDGLISKQSARSFIWFLIVIGTILGFVTISYSIIAISCRVYSQEKLLVQNNSNDDLDKSIRIKVGDNLGKQSHEDNGNDSTSNDVSPAKENVARMRNDSAKVILIQGFAYVLAFLFCQYNVIIGAFIRREHKSAGIAHMVTRPSQGIFNLIIFIGHKVYNVRKSENMSLSKAIGKVFHNGYDTPLTVSNIAMINQDYDDSVFVDDIPNAGTESRRDASNAEDRTKQAQTKSKMSVSDVSSGMCKERQHGLQEQGSHGSDSQSRFYDYSLKSAASCWNLSPSIGALSSTGVSYDTRKASGRRVSFFVNEPDLSCSGASDPFTREEREC